MNTLKLKAARVISAKTMESISKEIGISVKAYCDKENGKATFKLSEIKKISKVLNLDESEINDIFFDGELTKRLTKPA